jgi:ABC-type nitrate/sulfonate/bicarbonate transport system permease component
MGLTGEWPARWRQPVLGVGWLRSNIRWVTIIIVLAGFEALARLEVIPSRYFPPTTVAFARLWQELFDLAFWLQVGQTMQGWASGLGIAFLIAVPLGIAIGSTWWLFHALRPIIEFLRPVPSVALIPLAVLVSGTGMATKVFLVAFASVWPLLLQLLYGVRAIDPTALDTARSFRLRRRDKFISIVLPSALPYLATGLRISSSVALVLAVTAELVVGSPGIGQGINAAQSSGNVELMYALIIVTGSLGWGLNAVLRQLERRLLHWHTSQRIEQAAG